MGANAEGMGMDPPNNPTTPHPQYFPWKWKIPHTMYRSILNSQLTTPKYRKMINFAKSFPQYRKMVNFAKSSPPMLNVDSYPS